MALPDGVVMWPGGGGRSYAMPAMQADFKIDAESGGRYSISEWLLEPGCPGVGPHNHEANDDIFYVLEGTIEFLIGADWHRAEKGAFLRVPAGVTHDYRNTSEQPARLLNIYIPGDFESAMPAIVKWFQENK
jgi:quercetin dioxygenase-like cupin family protein